MTTIAFHTPAAQAQESPARGTISGTVVDATTSAPLPYATVMLTPADGFGVLVDPSSSSPIATSRTTTTSSTGDYRFSDLPIGPYRLRFQRVGYESTTLDIRLGDNGASSVSIGLVVLPVRLRPVEVRARDATAPTNQRAVVEANDDRVAAARARQQSFLTTDARELTVQDVAESATLGGSDVFRSLQRLPGVASVDDWSAKFWVRGNRWDHNRVYFDGVPLFDPLGVLGRTSGVSAGAIGGAFLLPGVRPVSLGGEGATRVDLRTRPVSVVDDWRGSVELSQFGVSASIERGRADSSAGILVGAQKSLGQWVPQTGFFSQALGGRSYRDAEASLRSDVEFGSGRRLEISGLVADDARLATTSLDSNGTSQNWTNAVGRATLFTPVGSLASSHTVSVSSYSSRSDRWISLVSPSAPALPPVATAAPVTSSVDYVTLSGRLAPKVTSPGVTTFGYDVTAQRSSLNGTQEYLEAGDISHAYDSRRSTLTFGSIWGERRMPLSAGVTLEGGARLDVGGAKGIDAVRPSGDLQLLVAPSQNTRLSVGASRVHQYTQALPIPLFGQGETLPTSWLTSGGDVPVMSVDNLTAGVEQWVAGATLVAANAYARRTTGAITDDPMPGPLLRRPLFVDATESAQGVELSLRRLVGRATGFAAYSYSNTTTHASGLEFPSPTNRAHTFDAGFAFHFSNFNFGGAFVVASGAPFTRMLVNAAVDSLGRIRITPPVVREAPDARRLPNYSSLDASIDYTRVFGRTRLIAFGGAQNIFGRANATWYEASGFCENLKSPTAGSSQCRDHDIFETPVKLVPTIGVRLVVR